MMMRVDDLERRLQDLLFPLRPPGGIAVARSGRRTAGRRNGGVGLRARRGRAKYGATQHSRRFGQHRATRYRRPANRLLSHGFLPSFFWFEPAWPAADGPHFTEAEWKPAFVCGRNTACARWSAMSRRAGFAARR